jgi:glucosamine--fructose-6-phosphate aminotransferase (isomerizing)
VSRFRTEIGEQPAVARRVLAASRPAVGQAAAAVGAREVSGLVIAARGSSDHAATYAKYLFEVRNRVPVSLASPSEYTKYRRPPRLDRFCVLGISQSGSSPDVVAVVHEGRKQGALTLAITNRPDSDLAREAEIVLPMHAGVERSVPASKTYTASLLVVALLSQALAPDPRFGDALAAVPSALERALQVDEQAGSLGRAIDADRMIVLGRGYHLATAQEVALKLTETSYLLAQAQSVADFLHGPAAVVEAGLPALVIDSEGPAQPDVEAAATLLRGRGARVIQLTDRAEPWPGVKVAIRLPTGLPEALTPLPFAVAGQLLAYHLACSRGLDPDHPPQLRKVTRTW